jgi:prevent-host-death family protein
MKVNMLEAKNRLSELVRSAQAGEEVVIANRGEPVARLIAVGKHRGVRTKPAEGGIVAWLDAHPLPARVRRSPQAIAAALAEERAAWD